jgi:hypothetical protein
MEIKTYQYYSEVVQQDQKIEKEVMENPSEEWRAVVEVSRHMFLIFVLSFVCSKSSI